MGHDVWNPMVSLCRNMLSGAFYCIVITDTFRDFGLVLMLQSSLLTASTSYVRTCEHIINIAKWGTVSCTGWKYRPDVIYFNDTQDSMQPIIYRCSIKYSPHEIVNPGWLFHIKYFIMKYSPPLWKYHPQGEYFIMKYSPRDEYLIMKYSPGGEYFIMKYSPQGLYIVLHNEIFKLMGVLSFSECLVKDSVALLHFASTEWLVLQVLFHYHSVAHNL